MSIRQAINERPTIVLGVSLALIFAALLVWLLKGPSLNPMPSLPAPDLAFYSDDDGQTLFVDDAKRLTPFVHDGKEAVRAYVYRCGRTRFVGYLQRHTDFGRRQSSAMAMGTRPTFAPQAIYEIKRPGTENQWMPVDQKDYAKILSVMGVSCPADPNDTPVLIYPGQ
jgi:hypothetical protein